MIKNIIAVLIAVALVVFGCVDLGGTKGSNSKDAGNGQNTSGAPAPKKPLDQGLAQTSKQPTAKKPSTKKPLAKQPPTKKAPSRKPTAKKPIAKKPPTKKPSAKKPAPRKRGPPASTAVYAVLRGGQKVDVGPTLARIKAGKKHSHRNDGSVFQNRERRLPRKQRGYYREYVHPTPNIRHAGKRRIILGQRGEIYYTHDHYKTFVKVQVPKN